MNLLLLITDAYLLLHIVEWVLVWRGVYGGRLPTVVHQICSPLTRILSQSMQLAICGKTVSPETLSIIAIFAVRLLIRTLFS